MRTIGRALTAAVLAATVAVVVAVGVVGTPAGAQDPGPTATTAPAENPDIIPEPNSGSPPDEAGDRGGWLQTGLFVLIVVVVVVVTGYLVRDSRRRRHARGF